MKGARAMLPISAAVFTGSVFAQSVPQPAPVPAGAAPTPTGAKVHSATAAAAAPPDGKALFQEKCVMCHGKVGMGTGLLGRRVQPAELLARTDLDADFVVQAARTGIGNMPAIPRGEVSDAELKAIAAFLSGPRGKRP